MDKRVSERINMQHQLLFACIENYDVFNLIIHIFIHTELIRISYFN